MTIKIEETIFDRKSINNHTDKDFYWNGKKFSIDKETDSLPVTYRLWAEEPIALISNRLGSVLVLDYFCYGETWAQALKFVEGFLTAKYGKQENA